MTGYKPKVSLIPYEKLKTLYKNLFGKDLPKTTIGKTPEGFALIMKGSAIPALDLTEVLKIVTEEKTKIKLWKPGDEK
jgi:hypothetical protein